MKVIDTIFYGEKSYSNKRDNRGDNRRELLQSAACFIVICFQIQNLFLQFTRLKIDLKVGNDNSTSTSSHEKELSHVSEANKKNTTLDGVDLSLLQCFACLCCNIISVTIILLFIYFLSANVSVKI